MKRKLFCEYGPVCYWVSLRKECLRRDLADWRSHKNFSNEFSTQSLPVIVKGHSSALLRELAGVDPELQKNKVKNLTLAVGKLDGLIVRPGQTFSFWKLVGDTKKERGYLEGLTIANGRLGAQIGGGLCQLANLIHWLVLHSPLAVSELHHHTDAIFPDSNRRIPFGTGTSIFYKNVDYRFENHTDQEVQLRLWVDESNLNGELRARNPYPYKYRIEEEDHHFARESGEFYRNSRIYRRVANRQSGEPVDRELLLVNHSKVLYDYALIPREQIQETSHAPE